MFLVIGLWKTRNLFITTLNFNNMPVFSDPALTHTQYLNSSLTGWGTSLSWHQLHHSQKHLPHTTVPDTFTVLFTLAVFPVAGFLATQLRTSDGAYPLRVKSSPLPCTICPSRFQVYVQGGEQSAEHSKLDGTPTVITSTPVSFTDVGPSLTPTKKRNKRLF